MTGVRIVYLPRHGYIGADTLRYPVRSWIGRITYSVDVTIAPDTSTSRNAVPADISSPANDTLQSPGPIPACTALAS
jgi:hypothetical protein